MRLWGVVLNKELHELFRTRFYVRLLVVIAMLGAFVPAELPSDANRVILMSLYGILAPIFISFLICADLFAGEKERGTLTTLLSMPISRWKLYIFKSCSASVISFCSSFISVVIFIGMEKTVFHFVLPSKGTLFLGWFVLCILVSLWASTFGTIISWLSPDVRTAQTTTLIPFMVIAVGVPFVVTHFAPSTYKHILISMSVTVLFLCVVILLLLLIFITASAARLILQRSIPS